MGSTEGERVLLKRRLMAVLVAVLLVLPLAAGFAVAGVPSGSGTFVDDDGNYHEANIELIAAAGITVGCDAVNHLYCPDGLVTRAQMVTFLIRALGESPSATYHGYFSDVPDGQWYTGYVERAFELGLTTGYPDGTYRPDMSVTRAEVAVFILRALGEDSNLPAFQGYFADVAAGEWYAAYAEHLYELKITNGCDVNPLRYCGDDFLRRDEMASFLARAFLLTPPTTTTTSGGPPPPPPPPPPNHAPVAVDDVGSTPQNTQLVVGAPGVLGNDTDPDAGDTLTVSDSDTTSVQGGTVAVAADGSYTYDPPGGFAGSDSFGYTVSDGVLTDTGTVNLTVTAAFVSDDFYGATIDTSLWDPLDPVSDSTFGISGTGNQLVISVPAGSSHDLSTASNTAPRLLQPAADTDFTLEVKFQSQLSQSFQDQGIIIQEAPGKLLRFDVYASDRVTKAYAGLVDPGGDTIEVNQNVPLDHQPMWLRVTRAGDSWTYATSGDGSSFTDVVTFTQALTVTQVGVYAGNTGTPAPRMRAVVDYFFNSAAPITPEDGGGTIFDIWYGDNQQFGNKGVAQKWIDILGNVDDPDGINSLSYTLNGGSAHTLSMGPDTRRLLMPGDFDVQISTSDSDLNEGANTVLITAIDGNANSTPKTVNFTWDSTQTWLLPYSINWGSETNIQDVAQVVDGQWKIDSGLLTVDVGYDRLIAIGDTTWDQYEVEVPITIRGLDTVNGYDSPSNGPALGILMGWDGHEDCSIYTPPACDPSTQPKWGWWPSGDFGELRWTDAPFEGLRLIGFDPDVKTELAQTIDIGSTYVFKMQVGKNGSSKSVYSLKIWKQGTAEPLFWQLTNTQDDSVNDPTSGSFLLLAHHVDVAIGNISVNRLPVAVDDVDATLQDTPLVVGVPGLLGNDTDPDPGDTLTVYAFDAASVQGGTVAVAPDGSYTYNPPAGYVGSDSFTYTVQDNHGATSPIPATVTINVTAP